MARICILYTGGTIGMVAGPNGVRRPPEDPSDFLKIAPQVGQIASFDFLPLLNKDSIDMVVSDWVAIATAIYERRGRGYDGFVVVHGVDTMAFAASAVAFALGRNLNFPVVFVGGQTLASQPHGDGQINLIRACKVATLPLAEVAICFNNLVLRGCRAQKKDDRDFDAFESPGVDPLCVIKDSLDLRSHAKQTTETASDMKLRANFVNGILTVPITPATPPAMLLPAIRSNECRGVILQTSGGGNIPNVKEFSFLPLVEESTTLGKPVIITSMFPTEPNEFLVYQSGIDARNRGAIQMSGMAFPALATKFSWVLAQLSESRPRDGIRNDVERMMKTPYVGEVNETPGFSKAMDAEVANHRN